MRIIERWTEPPPKGMGSVPFMSRALAPHRFGEDLAHSTVTQILLRAWMLWRTRVNGFADSTIGRTKLFDDEADKLSRDIRKLPATDVMLGDGEAASLLRIWAPDVYASVAGPATSGAESVACGT